jgi:hypothetical protein
MLVWMSHEPELPEIEALQGQTASGAITLRYEDLAQDGRLKADAVPFAMGETCWRGLLLNHPLTQRLAREGIVPILRRLVVAADETPLSTAATLRTEGSFALAVSRDASGERFLLELATTIAGPRGRTFAEVDRAGEVERVARVYGEHVFTRLFAPPERRRVRELPEGLRVHAERAWLEPEDLLARDEARLDGAPIEREVRFSLVHTDSNQHVNSLVYPRLFEELATELFEEPLLARGFDVAFRKPCFVGERVSVVAQRVKRADGRGARVWLKVANEERVRCAGRLWLR